MSDLPSLQNEHQVAAEVQSALVNVGKAFSRTHVPDANRWIDIAKRLRVDKPKISRHSVRYEWMDAPQTSWEVPVLVDPGQSPMYPVYELMSEAEEFLGKHFADSFFLIPAVLTGTEH